MCRSPEQAVNMKDHGNNVWFYKVAVHVLLAGILTALAPAAITKEQYVQDIMKVSKTAATSEF